MLECVQFRITKLRENCLAEFEKHWNCLEYNNQVCALPLSIIRRGMCSHGRQEYYHCRKDERVLNKCVFEKLVSRVNMALGVYGR